VQLPQKPSQRAGAKIDPRSLPKLLPVRCAWRVTRRMAIVRPIQPPSSVPTKHSPQATAVIPPSTIAPTADFSERYPSSRAMAEVTRPITPTTVASSGSTTFHPLCQETITSTGSTRCAGIRASASLLPFWKGEPIRLSVSRETMSRPVFLATCYHTWTKRSSRVSQRHVEIAQDRSASEFSQDRVVRHQIRGQRFKPIQKGPKTFDFDVRMSARSGL
jgi:hypothetical protein